MATTMTTAADGRQLHLYDWAIPEGAPALTVALLHGYGEHAGRYAHVAEAMNARGISVVAGDLRGHGKSDGTRGHILHFQEYHLDAAAIVGAARSRAKGGPVAVLAHSMGALLLCDWLLAGGGKDLSSVVLTSPFLGIALEVNPVKAAVGRAMSKIVPALALSSGLRGADVCRDAEIARRYDVDPLNNKKATARWFTETIEAIERVHRGASKLSLPLLLLYGGDDRVASADATDRFARALRPEFATFERLDGIFHEIVNEPAGVREPIIDRMALWLLDRTKNLGVH